MALPPSIGKAYHWPPTSMAPIFQRMYEWSAWYTSDTARLQQAYGGGVVQDTTGFFASDAGGVKPSVAARVLRWFVGEPTRGPDRNTKLIIPIAAEIAAASADLLFADPVKVKANAKGLEEAAQKASIANADVDNPTPVKKPKNPTQERLDVILDDDFDAALAQGAEVAAALGGVFMRASWDVRLMDQPFATVRDTDSAIPEFWFGKLRAVTFWDVVFQDPSGKDVYRLLERHELDTVTGNGILQFGLYRGGDDYLGDQVSLSIIPQTRGLVGDPAMQTEGLTLTLDTRTPGLAVVYIANQLPQRLWRTHPIGRFLGRSDFDGIEHLMDQLAETMSAWLRAIRLGKARLMVAKELVKSAGPGNGAIVNTESELLVAVEYLGTREGGMSEQMQLIQPTIEVVAHQTTAQELTEQILQMAGYSMQTFGVGDTGSTRTATEVEQKERRSLMTRSRKIRAWKPGIQQLVKKMLLLDNAFFGGHNVVDDIDVRFSDGVQETQLALAQTVLAMFSGESASLEERVRTLHPDWDVDDISIEVELARKEFAAAAQAALPDPLNQPFEGTPPGAPQPIDSVPTAPAGPAR